MNADETKIAQLANVFTAFFYKVDSSLEDRDLDEFHSGSYVQEKAYKWAEQYLKNISPELGYVCMKSADEQFLHGECSYPDINHAKHPKG